MRGKATWLAVAAVVAVALAAGLDALRGESTLEPAVETRAEPPAGSPATTPVPHAPATGPAFEGTLYYTDESCELRALDLSDSTPATAPNWDECSFVLSPDDRRVSSEGSGWDPHSDTRIGRVFQSGDGLIQVSTNRGPEGEPFAGEAPAWKPDGTLTYFADGAVREWPSGDAVLSQRALLRAIADYQAVPVGNRFSAVAVRESVWLENQTFVAILTGRARNAGGEDLLALFEGTRLRALAFDEPGGMSELTVSPGRRFVASKVSGRRGQGQLAVINVATGETQLPGILRFRAIAWSPDEAWTAIAANGEVVIFSTGTYTTQLHLDLDAHDLDWRGEGETAALAQARDARLWLESVGATGRLFVTQESEGRCRLRVLELPGLEWADDAPGLDSPCRFAVDDGVALAEERVPRPGGGRPGSCGDMADCSFAWTPDGRPTFVSGGELFAGTPGGRSELLVSGDGLAEIFDGAAELEEIAWLDEKRFWAVVRRAGAEGIALMSADALVYSPWFAAPRVEGLHVSSAGMVAASSDRGVVIFDGGGRRRLNFTNGLDVSWAPGDLIAAVSTPREILFVAPINGDVVSFPLEVEDLEWVAP